MFSMPQDERMDVEIRYIEERAVSLPAPAYCVEDSDREGADETEIASLNMQLQQAHTVVKEKTGSDPILIQRIASGLF